MKVISKITDDHVVEGGVYCVAHVLEDQYVIVWDDDGELWDLFDDEYEVINE